MTLLNNCWSCQPKKFGLLIQADFLLRLHKDLWWFCLAKTLKIDNFVDKKGYLQFKKKLGCILWLFIKQRVKNGLIHEGGIINSKEWLYRLILMTWRPCHFNLVMISSLHLKFQGKTTRWIKLTFCRFTVHPYKAPWAIFVELFQIVCYFFSKVKVA